MRMKNGKKQRLWMKVIRSEGGVPTVIFEPVHPNATIGEMMELEKLLNKLYAPITFDLDYEWKDVDIVSAAEVLREGTRG